MTPSTITIDPTDVVGPVPRRLFGTFVEHMGRSVYDGIYEPGHPAAGADGFRSDVADLVRELGATTARYPGGNFVSGYRWEDGVGPVDERPVRLDAAWHSLETNRVGLHEFADWAESVDLELVYAVNLGTRGVAEAADVLEYINHPKGTALSERRRANGADAPFGVSVWCLGNEMDGPWQIGHKTADEYGRLAAEAARVMRFIDPDVELVAAGSSSADMPTFGEWERTVLRHTAGLIDHISLHAYYEELDGDVDSFLASAVGLDRFIEQVVGIVEEVRAEQGIERPIGISVDEWNVWYLSRWNDVDKDVVMTGDWPEAPRLIEDEYSVTDAVVVGSLLSSLLRHVDHVTMANLAQLVNVIAPIRTEPGGPAWRQTTFFPFQRTAALASGTVVRATVDAPEVATSRYGAVPVLDTAVTMSDDGTFAVFVTNRSTDASSPVELLVRGSHLELASAETLHTPAGADRHTRNTQDDQPVGMAPLGGVRVVHEGADSRVSVELPALSWSAISLRPTAQEAPRG
ncbi:alpha-N-arabinofuranosidase [Labedella gwakjiensis]|uniref:non-reducing end alpha-L-arabinofuranosidase n=2 Tax=Labedella gwakjiensis TaxID=390269 RepID=A0A2P8GXK4_9MICO|nr:alpha-L-arabinofuranosidase C-terminal domain-containing protein [Labedella gwakjiensis]PSL38693.1 alpha-N-arabinofuranosidase [Labedella gwakjiensis]